MIFVGKSIIDEKQLISKQKYGIKDIEIQLYGKDFDKDIQYMFDVITKDNINVVALHMPLDVGEAGDLNLEFVTNKEYSEMFIKTCRLAQELADFYEHDINIIIHNGISLKRYLLMPVLLEEIIKLLDYILEIFPNINFSIENVLPISFGNRQIATFEGFLFDNVELAEFLNKTCIRPAFFTTLDICHILCTFKVLDVFKNEDFFDEITIRDFFDKNKNTLNNIHFCNIKNWGLKNLDHGYFFDKNNKNDLILIKQIFDLLDEFKLDVSLTLEVRENDYIECENFKKTLDAIKQVRNI